MASISEILIGQADQTIKSTKDEVSLADSIGKGVNMYSQVAKIAMEKEQLEQQKQQMIQKKEELAGAKMEKFVDALSKGANYQGSARTNYYQKWLPKYRDSLGLTQDFPDESLKFATATPENLARIQTLVAKVQNGAMSRQDAIATLNNPTQFADVPPDVIESTYKEFEDAAKTAIGAQAQRDAISASNFRNEKTIEGAASRQQEQIQSAGQIKLAQRTAEDNAKFNTSGGQQAALAKIKKMEDVLKKFESGKIKTGGLLKKGVSMIGMQDVIDPELKSAVDDMRASISLKESLDSQFAQKEAEQQYNMRTIDPALPSKANIARIRSMLQEAKDSYNNKIQTFRAQGLPVQGAEETAPAAPSAAPDTARIQALYDKATPEQKKVIKAKAQAAGIKIKE